MENQQKKIFANCSQTVRSHCEFRNAFANHFRIAKSDTPVHCSIAKFFLSQNLCEISHCEIHNEFASQIRNAKISQSQFRNAKANFAMPKPNSQCQNQFRNAKILFMCHNLCEISHCEIHNPLCEFRKPISHCEIHCLLRNSHLQALSSSVINATDSQTW